MRTLINLLLIIPYYFLGVLLAFLFGNILAMICCAFVALCNILAFRWAWAQMVAYLLVALITWWLVQLCLSVAGMLGDAGYGRFHLFIFVGLIFPGVFALKLIPAFIKIAADAARGKVD